MAEFVERLVPTADHGASSIHSVELLKSQQKSEYNQVEHANAKSDGKYRRRSSIVQEFFYQAKATIFSSTINICNYNIGAGVLVLPFAVSKSGYIMAIVLFAIFGGLSIFSFQLLMSVGFCYVSKGQISSYAIVCNDTAPKLQLLIDISIAFGLTLACSGFLIIIGDYMPLVTKELANFSDDSNSIILTRQFWIFLFLILFILPTTVFRKLDELRFISLVAICCFVYVIIIIILFAVDIPGLDITQNDRGNTGLFPNTVLDFFEAAPLYIFAFNGHPLAFVLTNELKHPSLKRINRTLFSSFGCVSIMKSVLGMTGYATFGDKTRSNILLNYPDDNIYVIIVRIGISIAVAFSFPVLANPWKQSMASLLYKVDKYGKDVNNLIWYKYYILVGILIFVTLTISMLVDDLGIVFRLQGSTAGIFLQMIAPGFIYYYYDKLCDTIIINNTFHWLKLKGAIILIIFGCIMVPMTTLLVFVSN